MLSDVVGADVDCRCGRGGDHLDGHGLAVSAGDAVGLAFGGLNNEFEVGHVGRDTGHGEGLALAGDGRGPGVLDTDECRGIAGGGAAAGDEPVVEPGVQVAAGDLGFGAEDGTALLREGELVPGEDLVVREALPLGGELLEYTFDLGLVSGAYGAAVSAVADVLAALHLSGRNALGAAAHLLEGDGRNVLHQSLSLRRLVNLRNRYSIAITIRTRETEPKRRRNRCHQVSSFSMYMSSRTTRNRVNQ